ncbi:MAG: TM2 domain-containing protein [Deltaproteobacteria bacterium]|nr:TM2 domain-containing protein [Deltaproteobacteria bacterium]
MSKEDPLSSNEKDTQENHEEFLDLVREKVLERERELKEREDLDSGFKATLDALEQITQVPRKEIEKIAEDIRRKRINPQKDTQDIPGPSGTENPYFKRTMHPAAKEALLLLPQDLIEEYIDEYLIFRKKISIGYLFWLIPPPFTCHYFYLNKPLSQIFYSLTFGGFFFWWVVDLFRLPFVVIDQNQKIAHRILKKLIRENRQKGLPTPQYFELFKTWFRQIKSNKIDTEP